MTAVQSINIHQIKYYILYNT